MKRITKYMSLVLAGALAALTACGPEMTEVDVRHTPVVNGAKLAPMADEGGTVRAWIGTEVAAEGFNLDRVSRVSLGGTDAQITEQTIKTLKFKIPALDLPQQDAPHAVELKVYEQENAIFTRPYYVTVPVTDAVVEDYSPAEGTVGTEVTLSGRNLEQITRVRFGDQTVEASAFTEVREGSTDGYVKFLVPAGTYAAGDSKVAIAAEWGVNTIDVTGEAAFMLHTPRFDAAAQAEGAHSAIGDELTLTGANLDLVSAVKWGANELIVLDQSAEAVTVKFPSSIDKADPVIATAALTALWGAPEQIATVAAAWRVDTTPAGPAAPVLTTMTAEDGGADNKFYLGKTITVAGENLASVEGFTVDGVTAALAGTPTDVEARFVVPEGVTFTAAKEVAVVALYNGGNEADFGTATVYPFYYYKDVEMGIGSSSKNTYPDYNREHAFFLPGSGKVISADEWYNEAVDAFAKNSPNALVTTANTLVAGTTAEQYYSVAPYLFFSASSSHKLGLNSPANSASQLKTHCYLKNDANTSLPATFGTPIFYFRVLAAEGEQEMKAKIADGSVTDLGEFTAMGGSAAPSLAKTEGSSNWVEGSVIAVQYINHTHGLAGGKPTSAADIRCQGFMYIKQITCADLAQGLANADREGKIVFDFYWSKTLNE